jgi:hypothetical protein
MTEPFEVIITESSKLDHYDIHGFRIYLL